MRDYSVLWGKRLVFKSKILKGPYSLGEPPHSKGNGKGKAKQRQYKSKAKAKQSEDKARERPRQPEIGAATAIRCLADSPKRSDSSRLFSS